MQQFIFSRRSFGFLLCFNGTLLIAFIERFSVLSIIFVVHSQIFIYFCHICIHVLNRVALKCCSAEHHKGKRSGLQCSSQVKETPWSLSYLTLLYRGNICRQESMNKVIQHCISKEFIQHELFGQKLQRKEENLREWNFLSLQLWTFTLTHVLLQYPEESDVIVSLILKKNRLDVHQKSSHIILVISNLPIKWILNKGERIIYHRQCTWFFQYGFLPRQIPFFFSVLWFFWSIFHFF